MAAMCRRFHSRFRPISAEVCVRIDEANFALLYQTLLSGVQSVDEHVTGLHEPEFAQSTTARQELSAWIRVWLAQQRLVFPGCEAEVAETLVSLAGNTLNTIHTVSAAKPQPLPPSSKIIDLTQRPEYERLVERHDDSEDIPLRQLALF